MPYYKPGDQVLVKKHHLNRTKIDYPFNGPLEVVKRLENPDGSGNVFIVKDEEGHETIHPMADLKKFEWMG